MGSARTFPSSQRKICEFYIISLQSLTGWCKPPQPCCDSLLDAFRCISYGKWTFQAVFFHLLITIRKNSVIFCFPPLPYLSPTKSPPSTTTHLYVTFKGSEPKFKVSESFNFHFLTLHILIVL